MQQRLRHIDQAIQILEEFTIDQLSRLATYLGPLAPAFLVYHALLAYIDGIDRIQALIIAATIELLGLAVVSNWLAVREWNRLFPQEPLGTGGHLAMVAFYTATVGCIVFGLKVDPVAFSWLALLSLSTLSLISAIAFVMRRQHAGRLRQRQEEEQLQRQFKHQKAEELHRIQLEELRAQHRAKLAQLSSGQRPDTDRTLSSPGRTADSPEDSPPDKEDRLRAIRSLSATTPQDLAGRFGITARTARRDLADLGWQKNGDGQYHPPT